MRLSISSMARNVFSWLSGNTDQDQRFKKPNHRIHDAFDAAAMIITTHFSVADTLWRQAPFNVQPRDVSTAHNAQRLLAGLFATEDEGSTQEFISTHSSELRQLSSHALHMQNSLLYIIHPPGDGSISLSSDLKLSLCSLTSMNMESGYNHILRAFASNLGTIGTMLGEIVQTPFEARARILTCTNGLTLGS